MIPWPSKAKPIASKRIVLFRSLLIIGIFVMIGCYFIIRSLAASPTLANIWIAPGGTGCSRYTSAVSYSSPSMACSSIQAALGVSTSTNDVIVMKAGNYTQNQSVSAAMSSPGRKIIGETEGAGVTVNGLSMSGSWIDVQNVTSTSYSSMGGSNNTWTNVEITGQESWMNFGGTNNTWKGGSMHDLLKHYGGSIDEPMDLFGATNPVIDGVDFYNINRTPTSDENTNPHLEIIRIDRGSSNVVIQNSYFHDNDENSATIFFTQTAGTPLPSGLTLYNNRFGDNPTGSTNLGMRSSVACGSVLIAYNTFLGGTNGVACSGTSQVKWVGNVGSHAMFDCQGSFSYNVWQAPSGTCGANDTVVTGTQYSTNALGLGGSDGFHISTDSPAKNKGETPSATSICSPTGGGGLRLDAFGNIRPSAPGERCDAGAHEYGSTGTGGGGGGGDTIVPTVSITSPSTGATVSNNTSVTASAADNVGVTGVQFKLDGASVGSEDTSSPYSTSWDTTSLGNGSHALTAVARDAAGNTATSAVVSVTVSNSGGTPAPAIRYVSPTGSNTASNTCLVANSPCSTLSYAYTQASAGDTIQLASGSYGTDTVASRTSLANGDPVIVKPTTGATVTFTDINENTSNITFRGPNFNVRSFDVSCYSCTRISDVTIDGLNIDAQNTTNLNAMTVSSVTNFTLKNSNVGNTMAGSAATDTAKALEFCGSSTCYAQNVLLEGNTFYDVDAPTGSAAHLECVFAAGIQGFTARKNRFQDCTYFDIFITVILANNQPQPKDYTIEDNLMGQTLHPNGSDFGFAIDVHADVQPNNFIFRRNTIEGAIATVSDGGAIQAGGWQITSNIIGQGVYLADALGQGCRSGITFSYNIMPNTCGTNTTTASASVIRAGWVSPKAAYAGNDDFHLLASSPAVRNGAPNVVGSTDFDGLTRASPADAGALAYKSTGSGPNTIGDFNGDGNVNDIDLGTLINAWNRSDASAQDLNNNSVVDIYDFSIFLTHYTP